MKKLSLAALLALGTCSAYAGISAAPLWVTLQPGASSNANVANITVNNADSATAYVQANVVKVNEIGNPDSTTTPYKPGDNPKAFGLLVSPTKFAIKPHSSVTVRVSNLNLNPKADSQYNILFTPVSSKPGNEDQMQKSSDKKVTLNMKIVVSYKSQVFVIPKNVNMKLCTVKNDHDSITVKNQGNTFAQLTEGQICTGGTKDCKAFDKYNYKIIPANGNMQIDLPTTGTLKYTVKYGKDQSVNINTATNAC